VTITREAPNYKVG